MGQVKEADFLRWGNTKRVTGDLVVKRLPRGEETVALFHQPAGAPERTFTWTLPRHMAKRDIGFAPRGVYSHGVVCDDERIVLVEVRRQYARNWQEHSLL